MALNQSVNDGRKVQRTNEMDIFKECLKRPKYIH